MEHEKPVQNKDVTNSDIPTNTNSTPNKSKSKTPLLLFIILLLILIIGGAYSLGFTNGMATQVKKGSVSISNKNNVSGVPTSNVNPTSVQSPTASPSQTQSPSQISLKTADSVVQTYYNWDTNCLSQHFASDSKQPLSEICPKNKGGVLSAELINKINQIKSYDPVLCAQNVPESLTFEKAVFSNSTSAMVVVHTHWGQSPTQNIPVSIQASNGDWHITSINCNM